MDPVDQMFIYSHNATDSLPHLLCWYICRVDPLYAFFVQWSPEIYGGEDEIDPKERGFVVIDDEEDSEDMDVVEEHFRTENGSVVRQMSKDWEVRTSLNIYIYIYIYKGIRFIVLYPQKRSHDLPPLAGTVHTETISIPRGLFQSNWQHIAHTL